MAECQPFGEDGFHDWLLPAGLRFNRRKFAGKFLFGRSRRKRKNVPKAGFFVKG
jgi:hypothetical protein